MNVTARQLKSAKGLMEYEVEQMHKARRSGRDASFYEGRASGINMALRVLNLITEVEFEATKGQVWPTPSEVRP